ncbi:MAG TPA: DNA polymerase I [Trueperaceae bacterium]
MNQDQGILFEGAAGTAQRNGHKIIIIDGHALAFRSYFAIRELTNSKGVSTNAVYGFVRSLLRILREEGEHDATVVTFDAPARTFRHEQYEDYKAGRAPTPDDLPRQIRTIKELVRLLGLHQVEVAGLEADDLIGTIAKRCEAKGYKVEIVTSDRDAYQLVSEHVTVRGLDKADRYGPDEVFAKYGVRVEQWTDYRALTGDSSDNIPGAKGIGPVTARKLLQNYGTLDHILENLDDIQPAGTAQKIRDSLEQVRFSRELSCIVTDADIDICPDSWAAHEPDEEPLRELLNELEFGSVLRELNLSATSSYDTAGWAEMFFGGSVGYALSDASPMRAELTDLAVASGGSVAVAQNERERTELLQNVSELTAADAKALAVYACRVGFDCKPGDDPLLMAYVLDPNTSGPEAVARRYGAGDWGQTARSRAIVTAELMKILPEKLTGRLQDLYERIEKPLSAVLADMERTGIRLDVPLLKAQSDALAADLERLEADIRAIAEDGELNVNSRDQLAVLLYDKLQLQAGKKTATGKRSTAVSALEPLIEQHPVVRKILDYRELSKLKSTYLDPLPRLVVPETGRVHTTFNQTVAATGRLSSTNPNLQNIPVRTEVGRQIRRGFIAGEGARLLVADYSQIELRILAHIADEGALIDAFGAGEDIHSRTAAEVHGVSLAEVTPAMRRVAKVINFGVLYGMSAHRLTGELGIGYEEAESFIKTYFARYPKVQAYIEDTLAFARKEGYVETLLGRRRMIPDIHSRNRNAREYAERTAYNMPIQGTAADIIKLAMIEAHPKLEALGAKLLLQVHDELVVEAAEDKTDEVGAVLQETMENAYRLSVPLVVEVGVGDNWLDAKQ